MKEFRISSKVIFDISIEEYFSQINFHKIFIVADPIMMELGFIDRIETQLKQLEKSYEIFEEITPDPTVETIAQGVWQMNQFQPDCLVAIGGGSAIDAAKGMVLSNYKLNAVYQAPYFIAIPSTSGTGSEVTSFTVITNDSDKKPFVDQRLTPDLAILAVELVKSVPAQITADTGMDVLTHALEAYVSTEASNFTDALAEKTVQLVFENLITAFREPTDSRARKMMHEASALAGMAFTNSSLGINHSLAHAIGGIHHLSHGRINAILLPAVIAFNAQSNCCHKYQRLAKILGLPAQTAEEGTENLILAIEMLKEALTIEGDFSQLNISRADYFAAADKIAGYALADECTKTNPQSVDQAALKEIYLSLYAEET